jgi:hypothetical protein
MPAFRLPSGTGGLERLLRHRSPPVFASERMSWDVRGESLIGRLARASFDGTTLAPAPPASSSTGSRCPSPPFASSSPPPSGNARTRRAASQVCHRLCRKPRLERPERTSRLEWARCASFDRYSRASMTVLFHCLGHASGHGRYRAMSRSCLQSPTAFPHALTPASENLL